MRNFSSNTRKKLGTVAAVASLALAAPLVATGTAHASGVRVVVSGTVSCARYGDSTPDKVTITPSKGIQGGDELPGEETAESYSVKLTGIPKSGTLATAQIACVDDQQETHSYSKTFQVTKPAAGPVTVNFR
ncbi:hypothetical protein ACIRBZ_13365 [Streptomyces sp. NPDC094038]|uniref:hypothetical protein n=1 Tax=Streptomyces sp. NPDC094038 TaxID=3366055 RepID=UPI0037F8D6BC